MSSAQTFNAGLELAPTFDKHLSAGVTAFTTKAVDALAEKYGFPRADAIEFLGLDQVTISRSSPRQSKEPFATATTTTNPS